MGGWTPEDQSLLEEQLKSTATAGGPMGNEPGVPAQGTSRFRTFLSGLPTQQGREDLKDAAITGIGMTAGAMFGPAGAGGARLLGAESPGAMKAAEMITRMGANAWASMRASDWWAPVNETPEAESQRLLAVSGSAALGEAAAEPIQMLGGHLAQGAKDVLGTAARGAKGILGEVPEKAAALPELPALNPGAQEAQALLRSKGTSLFAAQMGHMTELWYHIAEGGLFSNRMMEGYADRAKAGAMASFQDATRQFASSLSREDLGIALRSALQDGALAQQASFTRAAYKTLDDKIAAAGVGSTVNRKTVADEMLREFSPAMADTHNPVIRDIRHYLGIDTEPPPQTTVGTTTRTIERPGKPITTITTTMQRLKAAQAGVTKLSTEGSTVASAEGQPISAATTAGTRTTAVPAPGDAITFSDAAYFRSRLLQLSNKDTNPSKDLRGLASAAAEKMRKAMDVAALKLGPLGQEVVDQSAVARAASNITKQTFNDGYVGELLAKSSDEDIVNALKGADPSQLNQVRGVLFDKNYRQAIITSSKRTPEELWQETQGRWIADARASAGEGTYHELNGASLTKQLDSESFSALFPNPETQASVKRAARALELNQSKPKGAGQGVIIKIMQGRALTGTAIGAMGAASYYAFGGDESLAAGIGVGSVVSAGLILVTPAIGAKVLGNGAFTDFMMRRALGTGLRSGFRARVAGQVAARTVGETMSRFVKMGVPFIYQYPNGELLPYDPASNPGSTPGGNKPTSKYKARP